MKPILYILAFFILQASTCNKEKAVTNCFKARLEIKGICMNYTLSVIEGNIDTSLVETQWTDPNTGTSYSNAFRLGSPCTFPAGINQGDEFYFAIDNSADNNCAVCQAFYPTPSKSLSIKMVPGPCK